MRELAGIFASLLLFGLVLIYTNLLNWKILTIFSTIFIFIIIRDFNNIYMQLTERLLYQIIGTESQSVTFNDKSNI